MGTITVNLKRGQAIFENIEEYPLPEKSGVRDYVFYFVPTSEGYGLGASVFFKKYYKNHITKSAKSLEDIIDLLHSEIQSKAIDQIREIVIVCHANMRELLFPVTKNAFDNAENKAKYQVIRPGTLVNLQEAFEADDPGLADFKAKRKEVIKKLTDTSRVTVRACNFGSSRDGLFALYSFFGGRANVYAPHEYQFFLDELGIGVNSRLKTDLDFYQHLVKQGFISRKTKHSESRKVKIIKKLIEPGRGKHRFELSGYTIRNNRVVNGNKDEHDSFIQAFNQRTVPGEIEERFLQEQLTLSGEGTIQVKRPDEKWKLRDDQFRINDHTYKIEYNIQVEYEHFLDNENHKANLYVYPVLNHRKSLPSIPLQLFFSDHQNDEYKGQIFELARYPTFPDEGPDTDAKENYDAYRKLLDEGNFQDNNGHNMFAAFEEEAFGLTNPKIVQLPPVKDKKQWEILDEITLGIKEVVESISQNEQVISLITEYKDKVIELAEYWLIDDQIEDIKEKREFDAYEKLLDEGKMKDDDGHNIIRAIMGNSATKNAKIKQLSPVDGKKRWEFQCSIIYEIREAFYYIYPEGFMTALKVFEPVTRGKRLDFFAFQGSDPDTPGTELLAYLDNRSLEELYDLVHFLRDPYKEEHAFYIYMAQEAMKRKAEFMTWPVKTEEDEKRKSDPIYIYPSWATLNDAERAHKEKYAYTFSNVWMEAKASSSRNKAFDDDLFEERKLPFPSEILGEIMEPDTPEIDSEIMEQDPNNPGGVPDPPPEFFEKEMVFEQVSREDLSCREFKEALEIIKQNRGESWEEIERIFKETRVKDSSATLYDYLTDDYGYNSFAFANDALQVFSPYASRPGIVGLLGRFANSRLAFGSSVFFAITGPPLMLESILKEKSKGKEKFKRAGIITGFKQGQRMIWRIIYQYNTHGIPIADSYDIAADAPDHFGAHRRFLGGLLKLPFTSWLEAHEEGYEIGLQEVEKALNVDLKKHNRIFKQYVTSKGLKECHFKELLNSGLIDENMVKRAILQNLYDQISKSARYELVQEE